MINQVEYKGEVWEVETIYVYDELISIYQGNLLETDPIKVSITEVKKSSDIHNVISTECIYCHDRGIVEDKQGNRSTCHCHY
jgi:hypothetical protein